MAVADHSSRAKSELFSARRSLSHLVELYNSGQWNRFYKEAAFAEAVRQARLAVEHWTAEVTKSRPDR
jgi:uncharacterized repeat protein (TIGR03809 family)